MEQLETLLLQLYGGLRECGGGPAYTDYAMSLFKPVLNYDSARMTVVDLRGGGVVVRQSLLFREPTDMMLDWAGIAARDLVMGNAMAKLNQAVTFHARSIFSGPGYAILRDFTHRYEHRNGAVQIMPDPTTGHHIGMSLYRAADTAYFTEPERLAVQRAMPVLAQAIQLSGTLHVKGPEGEGQGRLAIASFNGGLHYCGPAFEALLKLEWPDWRPPRLPPALMAGLGGGAARRYQGRHALFTASVLGERLFLRGRKQFRLDLLASREREVARLFAAGHSHKEIARLLGVAPATVRNTVQRIYQKLAIGSRTQLANMIAAHRAH